MDDIIKAHKVSVHHRAQIEKSVQCGCFHCLGIFAPKRIDEWTDFEGDQGQTALCPRCGVDSVIGDASGYSVTTKFLTEMKRYWF